MTSETLRSASVLGNPTASEAPVIDASINSIIAATNLATLTSSGGWQAKGTPTNDTPPAGYIGESAQWNGSLTPLTSGSWAGLASIALTPGDWDIWALVQFNGGTTTQVGQLTLGFGTTATGHELGSITTPFMNQTPFAYSVVTLQLLPQITRLSAPTTIWISGQGNFSVSTCSAIGYGFARRCR